jgi:hypothetical protein
LRVQFIQPNWLRLLIAFLGVLYIYIGLSTAGAHWYAGILGGAGIIAGSILKHQIGSFVLIVLGAIPLALFTWWSIVTPLIALMAIVLSIVASRNP